MTTDQFWSIIEAARADADGDASDFCEAVADALRKLPPAEVAAFKAEQQRRMIEAYTWPVWGAAHIVMGGCGDDMFEYWRGCLIAQGRGVFEQVVRDPDSLATLGLEDSPIMSDDSMDYESFSYVAAEVYEELTDEEMPASKIPKLPKNPAGKKWSEDGDDLQRLLPKVWKAFEE